MVTKIVPVTRKIRDWHLLPVPNFGALIIMANKNNNNSSFEQNLFKAADKLRKNMDAAEYKHITMGLIFLKYISDSFESLHEKLKQGKGKYNTKIVEKEE